MTQLLEPPYAIPAGISDVITAGRIMGGAKVLGNGSLSSEDFVAGSSGWIIYGNGAVEFNSGTFRGAVEAASVHIPDATTANGVHINGTGQLWLGATTFAGAPAKIDATGQATFTNINISGASSDVDGGVLSGTIDAASVNVININGANIQTGTITGTQIDSATITGTNIAALTITGTNIAALTITADEIDDLTITTGKIGNLQITEGKIAGDAVTAAKLAAIELEVGKHIQSTSFTSGSSGWEIDASGSAEFNDIWIRNTARIGTSTSAYFEVDSTNGNIQLFNTSTNNRGYIDVASSTYGDGLLLSYGSGTTTKYGGASTGRAQIILGSNKLYLSGGGNDIVLGGLVAGGVSGQGNNVYVQALNKVILNDNGVNYGEFEYVSNTYGRLYLHSNSSASGGRVQLEHGTSGSIDGSIQTISTGADYLAVYGNTTAVMHVQLGTALYSAGASGGRDVHVSTSSILHYDSSTAAHKQNLRGVHVAELFDKGMAMPQAVRYEARPEHSAMLPEDIQKHGLPTQFGWTAEEVAEIFPEACYFDPDEEGNLTVPVGIDYKRMVPLLWDLWRETHRQLIILKDEVAANHRYAVGRMETAA